MLSIASICCLVLLHRYCYLHDSFLYCRSNRTACNVKVVRASPLHVTKFYILPMIGMALGIAFVDIHFSKTYRVEKDGSLIKYSQRLIVYSLLTDGFLGKQLYFLMNYF